jgi:hypothetical protein
MVMTLIPSQWHDALAPTVPWKAAYATVSEQARIILQHDVRAAAPNTITTTELVDILYPPQYLKTDNGKNARTRIFKALSKLAVHDLADCATRGLPVKKKFGVVKPWLWHEPTIRNSEAEALDAAKRCPHCGGEL